MNSTTKIRKQQVFCFVFLSFSIFFISAVILFQSFVSDEDLWLRHSGRKPRLHEDLRAHERNYVLKSKHLLPPVQPRSPAPSLNLFSPPLIPSNPIFYSPWRSPQDVQMCSLPRSGARFLQRIAARLLGSASVLAASSRSSSSLNLAVEHLRVDLPQPGLPLLPLHTHHNHSHQPPTRLMRHHSHHHLSNPPNTTTRQLRSVKDLEIILKKARWPQEEGEEGDGGNNTAVVVDAAVHYTVVVKSPLAWLLSALRHFKVVSEDKMQETLHKIPERMLEFWANEYVDMWNSYHRKWLSLKRKSPSRVSLLLHEVSLTHLHLQVAVLCRLSGREVPGELRAVLRKEIGVVPSPDDLPGDDMWKKELQKYRSHDYLKVFGRKATEVFMRRVDKKLAEEIGYLVTGTVFQPSPKYLKSLFIEVS